MDRERSTKNLEMSYLVSSLQKQFMHIPYEQDIKRTFSYFITGLDASAATVIYNPSSTLLSGYSLIFRRYLWKGSVHTILCNVRKSES